MTGSFIPGLGKAQVTLQFTQGDGELADNVFMVDSGASDALTADDLGNIIVAFQDWFPEGDGTDSYKALMQSSTELVGITARDLTTQDAAVETVTVGISGTDGGDKLPQGLTFTLTARTGLSGRSFRGRTYLVGLTGNFLLAGQQDVANASHAAKAAGAFGALITAVEGIGAGYKLIVGSRFHTVDGVAGVPRDHILGTPITSYGYHDLFMDYQRRRAPGHNRHH